MNNESARALSAFQRNFLRACLLFVFVAALALPFLFPPDASKFPEFGENDFLEYWTAFQLMRDGKDLYSPELVDQIERGAGWTEERPLLMWNPPWALTFLSPILSLNFDSGARVFLGLNIGLALLSAAIAAVVLGFDGAVLIGVSLFALLNFPLYLLLLKGQISVLPLLGLSLLFFGLCRNRPKLAGISLVLLSLKPHLCFLLLIPVAFWVIKERRANFLFAAGLSLLVTVGATFLLAPGSLGFWWFRDLHRGSPLLVDVTQWKTSTVSFLFRNIIFHYTAKFTIWPMWIVPFAAALFVFAAAFTWIFIPKLRPADDSHAVFSSGFSWPFLFATLLPLSLALAPFGWIFDAVCCSISFLYIWALARRPALPLASRLILILGLLALQAGTFWYGIRYDPTLESYWFYAPGFFLLVYLGWLLARPLSDVPAPAVQSKTAESAAADPGASIPAFYFLSPLLLLTAMLRFPGIMKLPPYFDESGNILIALSEMTRKILDPVRQARPYLKYQFAVTKFIPADPLLVSRYLTSATALGSVALLFLLLRRALGTAPALLAAAIWAVNPCLVFHDRMALQDPFISLFLLAALSCFVLAKNFPELLNARFRNSWRSWLFGGVFFGLAVATKVTAVTTFPFLSFLLWSFLRRKGGSPKVTLDLIHHLAFFAGVAIAVNLLLSGTFYNYGIDHMALGHLGANEAGQSAGRVAHLLQHLENQYELIATYCGKPLVWIFLALFFAGLFIPATRTFAILCFSLVLMNTQLYRGRWYTRYLHSDFIFHTILFASVLFHLLSSLFPAARRKRAGVLSAAGLAALLFLLVLPQLLPIERDPLHGPVPKHDHYTSGYFSGLGARELRQAVDAELKNTDQLVVFACQFWCTGMYDLLLYSYSDPRLYVIPFELKHSNRVLGLMKAIEKFRSNLPGRTSFAVLFEPPRYPVLDFLEQSGLKTSVGLDLLRDGNESPQPRFRLVRIDEADRNAVFVAAQIQKRPYADNCVGPKTEVKLAAPPPKSLKIRFPRSLPKDTVIEISLNGETLVHDSVERLPQPLSLPRSPAAAKDRTIVLKFHCSDWIVPQLSSGARDNRAICAILSESLPLEPDSPDSDEQAAEDVHQNSPDKF